MIIYIFNLIIPLFILGVSKLLKINVNIVKNQLKDHKNKEYIKFHLKAMQLNNMAILLLIITAYILQVLKIGYIILWYVEIPIYFILLWALKNVRKKTPRYARA